MQGTAEHLLEYMNSKKRFVIPVYQRNYDWKYENCKQLFDDLVKLKNQGRKSHFFGCIVSVYDSYSLNDGFLIIDGQQRLTTVSLLLLAMCNLLDEGSIKSSRENLGQMIREEFLIDKWKSKETRIKLKPVKKDLKAFEMLFEAPSEHIKTSNLTLNYEYFCKRLRECDLSADDIFDALSRLSIINIRLQVPEDDPQLIFESLNSTGLALSEGDKIRNFVLMGQDVATQERFYEDYWNKIEECTNYDVSAFVRDFLSVKQGVTPVISRTYFAFKEYVQTNEELYDMGDLLKELLTYARYYEKLLKGGTGSSALDSCIFRLNWLETSVCRPFLLEVLHQHYIGVSLSLDDVTELFSIVESFVFRRSVCDVPTNALNKVFLTLNKDVARLNDGVASYAERLKYTLSTRRESGRFPDDAEFGEAFTSRQVYKMKPATRTYILERLENHDTKEVHDVWKLIADKVCSIEHIMPQTLTPEWKAHLGSNFASIHAEWCHRIANLTLTAYNSDYSNRSFLAKRDHPHGFGNSGMRMNQRIKEKSRWGLDELKERSETLKAMALRIWPAPVTTFQPAEKQFEAYSLEEEFNYTGRQITRFRWRGTDYSVDNWADMYQKVVRELHEQNPMVLERLMESESDGLAGQLFPMKEGKLNKAEIAPGIWILTHMDTNKKIENLHRFFELFEADPADLIFYLKDTDKASLDEPARYEIRRRYWTFALELIRSAHAERGSFHNVTGSSQNWINGATGHAGFSLCCVANQDGSRMELYLGAAEKNLNKKVFDALYLRRSLIEGALERKLQWERKDEGKASKIFLELGGVDIYDETCWPQMADFHATWSRRFYDVFVPHLDEVMTFL